MNEDDAVSRYSMNAWGGVDIQQYSLLTSAVNAGGWSALCPGSLTLRVRAPRKHSKGG